MLPTIKRDATYQELSSEYLYTQAQLKVEPLAAHYVVEWDGFGAGLRELQAWEFACESRVIHAQAMIDRCDYALNFLATAIHGYTKIPRGEALIQSPLHDRLFNGVFLSDFVRPRLGKQLDEMRGWVPLLTGSKDPILVAYGETLAGKIKESDAAVKAFADAEQEEENLWTIGARTTRVQEFHVLRTKVYGGLAEISSKRPIDDPLPSNFADQFFMHETTGSTPRIETRIKQLQGQVKTYQEKLTVLQAQLEQAIAEKASLEARETEDAQKRSELAEKKRIAAEALAAAAQLEKELGRKRR
jgi:hypothetical protein